MNIDFTIADRIVKAQKTLLPGQWLANENKSGMEMNRNVICDFMAESNEIDLFKLRATVSAGSLGKLSFNVDMAIPRQRYRVPIYRLDLKPTTPHVNGFKKHDRHSGLVIPVGVCHEHWYYDRISDAKPDGFARPLETSIEYFISAIEYVCDRLNIINPSDFPPPVQQGLLL